MDRTQKDRRKALQREAKARERAAADAALPLPKPDLAALFDHLDERLEEDGCDDTLRLTQAFLAARGLGVVAVSKWLQAEGGGCDCEVLANVEDAWSDRL